MNTTTMNTEKKIVLLSKKGMKELKKAISQLEHDCLTISRSLHDSDKTNGHDDRFDRNEKLLRLETLEAELHEKRQALNNAKLLPSKRTRVKVAIGSVVDLIDQSGRIISYTLVDSIEANPSDGRISIASPLGSSLLGKTAKEFVEWGNGLQKNSLQLVRIN